MIQRRFLVRAARLLLLPALLVACSDAGIQPQQKATNPPLDNLLQISGSLCTDDPQEAAYPVKILFIIDASGSMQFTDPNQQIYKAVKGVVDRLGANPSVLFSVIAFNGIVRVNSGEAASPSNTYDHVTSQSLGKNARFVPGNTLNSLGALSSITMRDAVTDYQGALGAAYRLLELDMLATAASERARTKYVTVFLSDGWPNPQCDAGCKNPQAQPVCLDRSTLPPAAKDAFPELKVCQDYNQPYQIYAKVDQIMRLRDVYSVGDLRMHTIWLRDPADTVSGQFGYNPDDAKKLLTGMAVDHGNGTFADYYKGDDVNFANIDYSAILRPFVLSQVLAWNKSAAPGLSAYAVDSDGDGVPDDVEDQLCTDPLQADTDGDGYSDGFEIQRRQQGFDPLDESKPWFGCSDKNDLDGDGLTNCEEQVLGTDPRAKTGTDSDGDRVPDGLEARFGTNPVFPDDAIDSDADGTFNLQEYIGRTDPLTADTALYRDHRAALAINDQGEQFGQRRCYDFQVSHIELAATRGRRARALTPTEERARCQDATREPADARELRSTAGRNRVMLYVGQAPRDSGAYEPGRWKVACLDVVWSPPLYKAPATGQYQLRAGIDLRDADKFDPKQHCVAVSPPPGS